MAVAPRQARATVNETLRDRGIAHAILLERLKGSEAKRIIDFFDKSVLPDLTARLERRLKIIASRGGDIDARGTDRMRDLLAIIQETVDSWTSGLARDLAERSSIIGAAEAKWQDDLLRNVVPIAWDFVMPATELIAASIAQSPLDGVLLKDIVERLDTSTKAALDRAIRLGLAEGESIPKIMGRVQKASNLARNSAEAVARTAVGHMSTVARQTYFDANADIIKAVQWHATLDTRTCESCGSLDGKHFPLDSGPRSPRHLSCRCTMIPVLKSMRELGLPLNDYEPATRASMNGQVPSSTTYNEWLKRQAPSVQDEALGPTRGRLFRTGEISVTDFVRDGELLNLDELRKREAKVFSKAGL